MQLLALGCDVIEALDDRPFPADGQKESMVVSPINSGRW